MKATTLGIILVFCLLALAVLDFYEPIPALFFIALAIITGIIGYIRIKWKEFKEIKEPDPQKYFNDIKNGD